MKKSILTALALIMAVILTACAAGASENTGLTQEYIPEGAQFVRTETDDGFIEHKYRDDNGEYTLLVDSKDAVRALEFDAKAHSNAKSIVLSADEAFAKLTAIYPEAELIAAVEDRDDRRYEWGILAQNGSDLLYYELDAESGDILDYEIFYGIGASLDLEAVLNANLASPSVTELSLDADHGRLYLEGEARTSNGIVEFVIDAETGILVEAEYDD